MKSRVGAVLHDAPLVDFVERRIALAVIGTVVHQPVLRLLVGVEEPLQSLPRIDVSIVLMGSARRHYSVTYILPIASCKLRAQLGQQGASHDHTMPDIASES